MTMTDREREILTLIKQNPLISQNELAELCGITRSGAAAHISNLMRKGYIQGKGYIVTPPSYVAVIGAINVDIYGLADNDVVGESSNVGHIVSAVGGIGRNIAFNLTRLGVRNYLISLYGDDEYGERVRRDASANGIDISHSGRMPHSKTSTFLSVLSADGRQIVGLDDMQISESITPGFLAQHEQVIANASAVAIDSSLPLDAIRWICERAGGPVFARVVSVNKATRLVPVLRHIDTLVLSAAEAELVSGVAVHDGDSARACVEALNKAGVGNVLLFMDDFSILYCTRERCLSVDIADDLADRRYKNGAASSALSALVWARGEERADEDCAYLAAAAAGLSMRQITSVYPEISVDALGRQAKALRA